MTRVRLIDHTLQSLQAWVHTSFESADSAGESEGEKGEEEEKSFFTEEYQELDLSPNAETLPLCEDLNEGQVDNGDSCWSTCGGQCPLDVLKPGLTFDFDEIGPGRPGCTSHFECIGNHDRILCHAVRAVEEWRMPLAAVAVAAAVDSLRPLAL